MTNARERAVELAIAIVRGAEPTRADVVVSAAREVLEFLIEDVVFDDEPDSDR